MNGQHQPDRDAMSRRRFMRALTALAVLVVVVTVVRIPLPNAAIPEGYRPGLVIDFGIGRAQRSGSQLVDVCAEPRKQALGKPIIEGVDGTCAAPSAASPSTSTDRPAILSTTPLADFRRCDVAGSTDRFPTDQLTTTSELVGVTGLRTLVRAEPQSPFPVPSGSYCGRVISERASGTYHTVEVLIQLDAKEAPSAWSKALLALIVGAGAGLGIRLLNDPFGKLLPLFRRMRTVRRWRDASGSGLPESTRTAVRLGLLNTEEAIRMLDVEAAEKHITQLETVMANPAAPGLDSVTESPPPQDEHARGIFWLLRRYWVIAFVAVVVVVAATGLMSQYVNNAGFQGTLTDWGALVAFGLAAQLTIQGVTEALGKLAPSNH